MYRMQQNKSIGKPNSDNAINERATIYHSDTMPEPKAVKTLIPLKRYFEDLYFMNSCPSSGLREAQCGFDPDPSKEAYRQAQFELALKGLIAVGNRDIRPALEAKIDSACLTLMYNRYSAITEQGSVRVI